MISSVILSCILSGKVRPSLPINCCKEAKVTPPFPISLLNNLIPRTRLNNSVSCVTFSVLFNKINGLKTALGITDSYAAATSFSNPNSEPSAIAFKSSSINAIDLFLCSKKLKILLYSKDKTS